MTWNHRCLIVPAAEVEFARRLPAAIAGPSGAGMWITPLSPTGAEPATHFISAGLISPEFSFMVPEQVWERGDDGAWTRISTSTGSPQAVTESCNAAGLEVTLAQVEAVFAVSDVTEQEPFVALGRLGLMLVASEG